ncbi:MAG: tetratricopeptide repeat protein [Hyphomicrobiales bacterium]|nr:tetratricopeptide repeat protein [Hyphomicrobiales bacterium]
MPPPAGTPIAPLLQTAVQHHRAGRLQQAEALYSQVLALDPGNGDALGLLGAVALQGGDAARAADLCAQAARKVPRNHSNHMNLGLALLSLGRADEGVKALQKAAKTQPRDPQVQFNLGLACLQTGRFRDAVRAFAALDRLDPGKPAVLMHLGVALARDGRPGEAVERLRRAAELAPNDAAVRLNLGRALHDAGQAEAAVEPLQAAARLAPGQADPLFALATALTSARRRDEAIAVYRDLLRAHPDHVDAHNNLSVALRAEGLLAEAEDHARRAAEGRPADIELWSNLGQVLSDQGRHDEAAMTFQRVIEAAPTASEGYRKMTLLFQKTGDFDRARLVLDRAEELGLDDPELLFLRALDGGAPFSPPARRRAEGLAGTAKGGPLGAATAHFALAQVLDREKAYDEAFAHLAAGNRLMARRHAYDAARADAHFDALERVFDADFLARFRGLGSGSERPVFILGMPRSGTTLAEQIVAGHSRAAAAGELSAMQEVEESLPRLLGGAPYPHCLADLDGDTAAACAARYLDLLGRAGGDPAAERVTDKLPPNLLRLGLIAVLLPRAHVVYCRRSAMATCFSLYQQRFTEGLEYAFDLRHVAHHYARSLRLMEHWKRVCPIPIHEVAYEDLVADPENQARALVAAAGLDWEDGCLRFFESAQAVNTASLWQVRQPIYGGSVEKWRRYAAHLGPLRDALAAAGVDPDS